MVLLGKDRHFIVETRFVSIIFKVKLCAIELKWSAGIPVISCVILSYNRSFVFCSLLDSRHSLKKSLSVFTLCADKLCSLPYFSENEYNLCNLTVLSSLFHDSVLL